MLLGDNPFNEVDHFSQERARSRQEITASSVAKTVQSALENGATGFVFTPTKKIREALAIMKDSYTPDFGLYPIFPDVTTIMRSASDRGVVGAVLDLLQGERTTVKLSTLLKGSSAAMTANPVRILRAYLMTEMRALGRVTPSSAHLKSVFLHELISELIVSFDLTELLAEFNAFVRDEFHALPGIVTRNFCSATEFLKSGKYGDMVVMAPFNKIGFQMNPSKEACEASLREKGRFKIIAMSVMAGGSLGLLEAVQYIQNLSIPVSYVVGVSSEAHAIETFRAINRAIGCVHQPDVRAEE